MTKDSLNSLPSVYFGELLNSCFLYSAQRWGKVDYVHAISSEAERPAHLV